MLYLTAGLRSPKAEIIVNVPTGIHATLDNTTVDVIGRGTVPLRDLASQSMGKTFSGYDHDAVGQVSISDHVDGSQTMPRDKRTRSIPPSMPMRQRM